MKNLSHALPIKQPPRVYFAGKVSKGGDYRSVLLGDKLVMSSGYEEYAIVGGTLIYGGPFAINDNHGFFQRDPHGCGARSDDAGDYGYFYDEHGCVEIPDGLPPQDVIARCLRQIHECDAIHRFIDSLDCYGTFVELGYAAANGKPIYLVVATNLKPDLLKTPFGMDDLCSDGEDLRPSIESEFIKNDLWFVTGLATKWCWGGPATVCSDLVVGGVWVSGKPEARGANGYQDVR